MNQILYHLLYVPNSGLRLEDILATLFLIVSLAVPLYFILDFHQFDQPAVVTQDDKALSDHKEDSKADDDPSTNDELPEGNAPQREGGEWELVGTNSSNTPNVQFQEQESSLASASGSESEQ